MSQEPAIRSRQAGTRASSSRGLMRSLSFHEQPGTSTELLGKRGDELMLARPLFQSRALQYPSCGGERLHLDTISADERQRRDGQLRQQSRKRIHIEEIDAAAVERDRLPE